MGEATPLDDRGRFTVRPEFRKFLGDRVVQILTPHGILLRPVHGTLGKNKLPPALEVSGDDLAQDELP